MNITVTVDQIVAHIYATSALHALSQLPKSAAAITTAQRRALGRVVLTAAATVAAPLAGRLTAVDLPPDFAETPGSQITFTISDNTLAVPQALQLHFTHAVTIAALQLTAIARADNAAADRYHAPLNTALQAIAQCIDSVSAANTPTPIRLTPYYT